MDTTLTVLGSGTLLPDQERHSAAHLVEHGDTSVLLDCGSGTLHGLDRHGVRWRGLTHVLVTHYHNDHVGDLAALLFALKRERDPGSVPLTLVGPVGFRGFLERLAAALGPHVVDPGFPLVVEEIRSGGAVEDAAVALRVSARSTPHTDESVAYRVELGDATVGYTGDTGPSQAVSELIAGCGVLVAECAQADPPEMDTHLSPLTLAEMARVADPGVLIVTHVYAPLTPDEAARQVGERWSGQVLPGRDGLRLAVPRGRFAETTERE